MQNNLPTIRNEFMNQAALDQIGRIAERFFDSNALPKSIANAEQLFMMLMAGHEAGMAPVEAMNSYYIVNGRVTIWGSAVIQQLRKAGWMIEWVETTDKIAKVTISNAKQSHTETYTIEEAEASGLLELKWGKKGTWQKFPKEMLRHKAIGRAVRFTCPEVLGGFYLKEEMENIDTGNAIDVQSKPAREMPDEANMQSIEAAKQADEELLADEPTPPPANEPDLPKLHHMTVDALNQRWERLMDARETKAEKREAILFTTLNKLYGTGSIENLSKAQALAFRTMMDTKINEYGGVQAPAIDLNDVKVESNVNGEETAEVLTGELVGGEKE